jgi:hypothetical protein
MLANADEPSRTNFSITNPKQPQANSPPVAAGKRLIPDTICVTQCRSSFEILFMPDLSLNLLERAPRAAEPTKSKEAILTPQRSAAETNSRITRLGPKPGMRGAMICVVWRLVACLFASQGRPHLQCPLSVCPGWKIRSLRFPRRGMDGDQ